MRHGQPAGKPLAEPAVRRVQSRAAKAPVPVQAFSTRCSAPTPAERRGPSAPPDDEPLSSTDLGVATLDRAGYIREVSARGAELLGRPGLFLMGAPLFAAVAPDDPADRRALLDHLRSCRVGELPVRTLLRRVPRRGRRVVLEVRSSRTGDAADSSWCRTTFRDLSDVELERAEHERRVAELLERLRDRDELVRRLALTHAEHEERENRRVAELLHDELQQLLFAARLRLGRACSRAPQWGPQTARDVGQLLERAGVLCRSLSAELSPVVLRERGFCAALQALAEQMATSHGLVVTLYVARPVPVEEGVAVLLYQSVREALFNVVKYAGIDHAEIEVRQDATTLHVMVSDSGAGFDPQRLDTETCAGSGLLTLSARARALGGSALIESRPGGGTRVLIRVPIADSESSGSSPLGSNSRCAG